MNFDKIIQFFKKYIYIEPNLFSESFIWFNQN